MISIFWKKYRHVVLYLFFGLVTTGVNVLSYVVCYEFWGMANTLSSMIAWAIAIMTAFVTNKIWVFDRKHTERHETLRELWTFISCRLATGALDIAVMYVGVDILSGPPAELKLTSNIIVTVLNYIASRFFIFRYGSKNDKLAESGKETK